MTDWQECIVTTKRKVEAEVRRHRKYF